MCMAQKPEAGGDDDRSPLDKADFKAMLPNINLLYMGCSVLILLDLQYLGRFW